MNFYQLRLIRRELRLLAVYRNQGRQPRLARAAYWRASSVPLAVGLGFFIGEYLGLSELQATIAALVLFIGLIVADMQLFISNVPGWIFARKILNWRRVANLHWRFVGSPLDLSIPAVKNRWDEVSVSPEVLRGFATLYKNLNNKPPTLMELILKSSELRILVALTGLTCVAFWLNTEFRGFTLSFYFFLSALNAKRLKAAIDFYLTWPVLKQAFEWEKIRQLSHARGD